jgi:hypothetical protein
MSFAQALYFGIAQLTTINSRAFFHSVIALRQEDE